MMNSRIALLAMAIALPMAPARADNQMGYQLLSAQEAAGLPRNHGALGMDIERGQQITDGGLTFDIIRVKLVRKGSPGALAGFNPGDEIIAVDGHVFPTLSAFASYVGSKPPGSQVMVDYIPSGGGPSQAQRVAVKMATGAAAGSRQAAAPAPSGLSTGEKVAIGAGAVALLGCYEMGCFNHRAPAPQQVQPQQVQPQQQVQPRLQ